MAEYFRRLASHAALGHVAIIDPAPATRSSPQQYRYSDLLVRVTVFRERLIAGAAQSREELKGARIGLLVPPGIDFAAGLLSIWSVKAIAGNTYLASEDPHCADVTPSSAHMLDTPTTRDCAHRVGLHAKLHHLSFDATSAAWVPVARQGRH